MGDMWWIDSRILCSLFFLWIVLSVDARRRIPLQEEDSPRKSSRSIACHLGRKIYDLEETWSPNLGPPFGVMYCIKCECVPIKKKRRIVGKVRCRNIKKECPKPSCDEPVLLPGQCCKLCPEDRQGLLPSTDPLPSKMYEEEEERNSKYFAALLTGRSTATSPKTSAVATGRFIFQKRNLYYSFYFSGMERPRTLQFLDINNNILQEHNMTLSDYQNGTRKICGVWKKLSRVYRKQLREELMFVSLVGHDQRVLLQGNIARYKALGTELFSALLTPQESNDISVGVGGTVILSIATGTGSMHMTVVFNGVFGQMDVSDVPVTVHLETDRGDETRLLEETVKIQKPSYEINEIEIRSVLDTHELKQLARGKLMVTIYSKNHPELSLQGFIMPRFTCDIFNAILSPFDSFTDTVPKTDGAGLALLYLGNDGSLSYSTRVEGTTSSVVNLTIEVVHKKRRKVLEKVQLQLYDGWGNGTLTKTNPKEIEMLYGNELFINVATKQYESEIRGKISHHLQSEVHLSGEPVLLKGRNTDVVGLAWVSVDTDCIFHYDVTLSGVQKRSTRTTKLQLEALPVSDRILLHSPHTLTDFTGNQVESSYNELSELDLARLDSGLAQLKVSQSPDHGREPRFEIKGTIRNVHVPGRCLPHFNKNNIKISEGYIMDNINNEIPQIFNCSYEGNLYEEGSQWTAEHDNCMMCSCHRGKVICDPVICPAASCDNPVTLPGECCSACINTTMLSTDNTTLQGCYIDGDKKFHPAGTSWHPYIPPSGFSTCVICTCNITTLKVEYKKKTCPPLSCPKKEAIRAHPNACCKHCPVKAKESVSNPSKPEVPSDEGQQKSVNDTLAKGGCLIQEEVYENGMEWHPRVPPFGEMKCVTCSCKDGETKCKQKKCPKLTCSRRKRDENSCCLKCATRSKQNWRRRVGRLRHKYH